MASAGKPCGTVVKCLHKAAFPLATLTLPSRYFKGFKILTSLRSSHEHEI